MLFSLVITHVQYDPSPLINPHFILQNYYYFNFEYLFNNIKYYLLSFLLLSIAQSKTSSDGFFSQASLSMGNTVFELDLLIT